MLLLPLVTVLLMGAALSIQADEEERKKKRQEYTKNWNKRRREWNRNEQLKVRWIRRIDNKLAVDKKVDTDYLRKTVGTASVMEINWALMMYFHLYEHEKGLSIEKHFGNSYTLTAKRK